MRATFFAVLSGLAALAQASTTPTTMCTDGCNPIFTPTLGQIVPVGQPINITWKPTTQGTVTLVLLRGPSTNVKPLYSIADSIANSGSFSWTPKTDLEADTLRYGLQLINDANGQFQYSVQFGISNSASPSGGSSSGSGSGSASGSAAPTGPSGGASQTPGSTVTPASSAPTAPVSAAPSGSASAAPTRVSTTGSTVTRSASSTRAATPSASASNAASAQKVGGALGLVGAVALLAL